MRLFEKNYFQQYFSIPIIKLQTKSQKFQTNTFKEMITPLFRARGSFYVKKSVTDFPQIILTEN